MAEIDIFHYRKGTSVFHLLDPGLKLLYFFIISVLTFRSSAVSLSLIFLSALLIFILESVQSKTLSLLQFFKKISFFLLFLSIIVLLRWISEGGREGLYSGLLYSWKLLTLLILSNNLISSTDTVAVYGAVYRLLKPLPFISAGHAAVMVSLTISFIPLIFDQYLECRDAYNSRLGSRGRNPLRKIFSAAFPLVQNTIFRADELALAMESRCYSENPTLPEMKIKKADIFSVFIMLFFTAGIIYMNIKF